jgi:CBS domain-containing protein
MTIQSVLAKKGGRVHSIEARDSIRRALQLLAQHGVGALVVVDDAGGPVGIVSERDIVREATRDEQLFPRPVSDIMTRELIVGHPQDELRVVGHTMTEKRIRHLPVVDQGRLVGIVSIGDVVKAQRDQYAGEVDTLQVMIFGAPADPSR